MSDETIKTPFWKDRPLDALSVAEWESLCDGCGKCCLLKLEDEDSGEVAYTRLHCKLFDPNTCRCKDYDNRRDHVPDCVPLSPGNVTALKWMPRSCAYRLVAEGEDLPPWHHLVCGDRMEIHRQNRSVLGKTVSEEGVFEEAQEDWIVNWNDVDTLDAFD